MDDKVSRRSVTVDDVGILRTTIGIQPLDAGKKPWLIPDVIPFAA